VEGSTDQAEIYTSTNSGLSWTANALGELPTDDGSDYYHFLGGPIASSSDGTKLVAVENFNGQIGGYIYTSTNSGATWTARMTDSNRDWQSVASSSDGTKLVAVVELGYIYTSADSGVTWTARESSRNWLAVASSSDGTKLVALVQDGFIYTSG